MDIGRALGAGFRLVQAHPLAVAVWTAINVVLAALSQFGLSSMFGAIMANAGNPSPDISGVMQGMSTLYLVQFAAMIVQLAIWGAVYRAVFRPDEANIAFLRISGDEGRLFLLGLITAIVAIVLMLAIFLPVGFMAGASAATGGEPGAGIVLTTFALMLLVFVAFIFIGVRFALAWPIAVAEGRVALGEAWRLSRGRFWSMFATALVLIIALGIAGQIVSALQFGGMFAGFTPGGDPEAVQRMMVERFTNITPISVVGWVMGGIVSTAWIVMMGAGIADTYLQLQPDTHDDLAEVYA